MSVAPIQPLSVLKPGDFASDQDIRWCPGCGDYSILMQTKKVLAKMGVDRTKTVFISDRKSTRLNSSHVSISYAVFCLKKKTYTRSPPTVMPRAMRVTRTPLGFNRWCR